MKFLKLGIKTFSKIKLFWDINIQKSSVHYTPPSSSVCTGVWDLKTHGDGVDVRHVAGERLPAHAVAYVPQLGGGVTGARHKGLVVWAQRQTHHISCVASEAGGLLACLNVPQCTARKEVVVVMFLWSQHLSRIMTLYERGRLACCGGSHTQALNNKELSARCSLSYSSVTLLHGPRDQLACCYWPQKPDWSSGTIGLLQLLSPNCTTSYHFLFLNLLSRHTYFHWLFYTARVTAECV